MTSINGWQGFLYSFILLDWFCLIDTGLQYIKKIRHSLVANRVSDNIQNENDVTTFDGLTDKLQELLEWLFATKDSN